MAISNLLLSGPLPLPLPLSHKPISQSSLSSFTLTHSSFKPRTQIRAKPNDGDSADGPDRLISALCYFYPFFDGFDYGRHVIANFPAIEALLSPLAPAIRVYQSIPVVNGLLVFFVLYFVVVRNPNFSRYVRFNTMQAILLDVLLIVPTLLGLFDFSDGGDLDLMMSFDSTVFWFLFVCLVYGSSSCLWGLCPDCPLLLNLQSGRFFEFEGKCPISV